MKKVEMMKNAIKAMKNELNGLKWTADKNGLHWEYLDITFELRITPSEDGYIAVEFYEPQSGAGVYVEYVTDVNKYWLVDNDLFYKDIDKAIYNAARFMIRKANYEF